MKKSRKRFLDRFFPGSSLAGGNGPEFGAMTSGFETTATRDNAIPMRRLNKRRRDSETCVTQLGASGRYSAVLSSAVQSG